MSTTPRPARPTPPEPASGPVPPRQIGWAVRLLQAAAVLQVVVTGLSIINISSAGFRAWTREALLDMGEGSILEEVVERAVKFSLVTAVAGGIVVIVIYLVLARFIAKGAMWARLAGGVIAIGSLYQITALTMPGGLVTIVEILVALAAITLCYIKPASTFFREKQIEALLRRKR